MTAKEEFIEDCYQQHYEFLWNVCRKKVDGNPIYLDLVNDCIQDTFLLAYKSYDSLIHHTNVRAWLTRTCLNRLLPYAKLQRKRICHEEGSIDDPSKQMETKLFGCDIGNYEDKREAVGFVRELLTQLSQQERSIFDLYFLKGWPLASVAAMRNCSIGTVKGTIHRIRKKAKKVKKVYFAVNLSHD